MKTVGEMLRETRISRNISLEVAEKETKIRRSFLAAIESDDFTKLPSQAYAKGFLKNYSEYLGLNSKNMMAFFRRQTLEIPKASLLPSKPQENLTISKYRLTPARFVMLFIIGLLSLLLVYFGSQYRKLQIPPAVRLESPRTETTSTTSKRIDVLGQTDQDATVTVNGISVLVRGDGKFFDQVQVFPGKNTITITVTSRYGKTTTLVREVLVTE